MVSAPPSELECEAGAVSWSCVSWRGRVCISTWRSCRRAVRRKCGGRQASDLGDSLGWGRTVPTHRLLHGHLLSWACISLKAQTMSRRPSAQSLGQSRYPIFPLGSCLRRAPAGSRCALRSTGVGDGGAVLQARVSELPRVSEHGQNMFEVVMR